MVYGLLPVFFYFLFFFITMNGVYLATIQMTTVTTVNHQLLKIQEETNLFFYVNEKH